MNRKGKMPVKITPGMARALKLLQEGNVMAASVFPSDSLLNILVSENVLQVIGSSKRSVALAMPPALNNWLANHYGINNLDTYLEGLLADNITRSDWVKLASDSKTGKTKVKQGIYLKTIESLHIETNSGPPINLQGSDGHCHYINPALISGKTGPFTLVCIENYELFDRIGQLNGLLRSHYPAENRLFIWRDTYQHHLPVLENHTGPYLHLGDFDPAGIAIFNSHCKHLALAKSIDFWVPPNLEDLMLKFGNSKLYQNQLAILPNLQTENNQAAFVLALCKKYGKGLEQEVLLGPDSV